MAIRKRKKTAHRKKVSRTKRTTRRTARKKVARKKATRKSTHRRRRKRSASTARFKKSGTGGETMVQQQSALE